MTLDDSVLGTAMRVRDGAKAIIDRLASSSAEPERAARVGDQPLPTTNTLPCIQDLVIADMEARKAVGLKRYGTVLQPHNGRDSLRDLYEELIDACVYIRQVMYERDHPA